MGIESKLLWNQQLVRPVPAVKKSVSLEPAGAVTGSRIPHAQRLRPKAGSFTSRFRPLSGCFALYLFGNMTRCAASVLWVPDRCLGHLLACHLDPNSPAGQCAGSCPAYYFCLRKTVE